MTKMRGAQAGEGNATLRLSSQLLRMEQFLYVLCQAFFFFFSNSNIMLLF